MSETMSVGQVKSALESLARTHPTVALALGAHIAALEADNAAKDEAFRLYVEERGVEHDDIPGTDTRCPEDDTCECPRIVALNAAFGPSSPGAALLAEHAKALKRARNEGLEEAWSRVTVDVPDALQAYLDGPGPHDYIINTALRAAQAALTALKEPEE